MWTKEIADEQTGAVAKVWNTLALNYDGATGITRAIYGGWVSAEAKAAGKNPLMVISVDIPAGTSPQLSGAVQAFAKNYALTLPQFQGAV